MLTTSLAVRVHATEYLPKLVKVSATSSVDRVTVRMLPGQVAEDYAESQTVWRRLSGLRSVVCAVTRSIVIG